MENYELLWNEAKRELQKTVSSISYSAYIEDLKPVDVVGEKLILSTQTEFFAKEIAGRLIEKIRDALVKANTGFIDFELRIGDSEENYLSEQGIEPPIIEQTLIDPKYTFESFVVGKSNEFASAAAKAVAKMPGESYNPLFIHGGTGLGKTHLLQAIANYLMANNPAKNVIYVTCEKLMNDFVASIAMGKNKGAEFRAKYRTVDVLIIDDVQFLGSKKGLSEEFFHTFNELYSQNKQIVLSSDRPPKEIPFLEERLRTRFEGGLMADIQAPDTETKIAILQKKAESRKTIIAIDVLSYIAERSGSDVRTLEGMLNKVIFASKLLERPIDHDLAESILQDSVAEKEEAMTVANIISGVCNFYKIARSELIGKRKNKEIVFPRQVCIYLITELMNIPLEAIGQAMGGRDHTTVMHSRDKIAELIKQNDRIATEVNDLKNMILKK